MPTLGVYRAHSSQLERFHVTSGMNGSVYMDHPFHLSYEANASCLHGISSVWQVKQKS